MTRATLSYATALVIQAISSGYRYGFDIMDATGLASGTVYPALRRMERQGLLSGHWEPEDVARSADRPARRYYELTASGAEVAHSARGRYPGLERAVGGSAGGFGGGPLPSPAG